MISIIICSCNPNELAIVTDSVKKTIGVPYEIIAIDNRDNKYNIFSAYNEGIRQAKGDILCFMHEDLLFHTNNWGKFVESHLSDEDVGIIGVAGGHYIPDISCITWWDSPSESHIIQGTTVNGRYYSEKSFVGEFASEVVACDGQWLCGRRDLFEELAFDDKTYTGFHCYDIDICMQAIAKGKKNYVVKDIIIEHKSPGNGNTEFMKQLTKFHEKWEDMLPIRRGDMPGLDEFIKTHQDVSDYFLDKYRGILQSRRELWEIKYSTSYRLISSCKRLIKFTFRHIKSVLKRVAKIFLPLM